MPETIYINGKFLSKQVTGVQRYALELLAHIDIILKEIAYQDVRMVCLAPKGEYAHIHWENIEVRQVGFYQDNAWEQLDLPLNVGGKLLFSPGNTGPLFYSNQVVTIHDASTFAVPQAYSSLFRAKYALIFHILARISKRVLTDSEFSQKELAKYLVLPTDRFKVILLGGDHLTSIEADTSILDKNELSIKKYFLTVASQSTHKNFASVLQLAERVKSPIEFAVAGGKYNRVFQSSQKQSIPANVHFLGYVNDRELKALYENALGFIFPSQYEGFGLPVLEAMSCGCPVISSFAASLPEVGGNAVMYFDPDNIADLGLAVQKFLADSYLAVVLCQDGLKQARKFSWDQTARQTLELLVSCL